MGARDEIDAWVKEHFHGSPIATDTALWNHFHAAIEALKNRLEPLSDKPEIEPADEPQPDLIPVPAIELPATQETVS